MFEALTLSQPLRGPLYLGIRGDNVKRMQAQLNIKRGIFAPIQADGAFGAKTDGAVRMFQASHMLKADGIVGPLTAKALGFTTYVGGAPPRAPSLPPRPHHIPGTPSRPVPPAPDASPLAVLATLIANHIIVAGQEIANAFKEIGDLIGDDVIPLCRGIRDSARAIGTGLLNTMVQALRSGVQNLGHTIAQAIRNAQSAMRRETQAFLDALSRVGLIMKGVIYAVARRVREMVDYVFDKAVGVASGTGQSIEQYGREVLSVIYSGVSSLLQQARALV